MTRSHRCILWLVIGIGLAGCAAGPASPPPSTPPSPTAGPSPAVEIAPTNDTARQRAATEAPPPFSPTPTAQIVSVADWRPPQYPAPLALRPEDHFYFQRPLPSSASSWVHGRYRYGNTHFGEEPTHTGIDIVTALDTPVVAGAEGEVVWAGYGLYRGLFDETDPYGLAVAIEHPFGFNGQKLYTVYGHLSSLSVLDGQTLQAGDKIGYVGTTGHASGPHLHFEVRLGENRYFTTLNPELWLAPDEGSGVLVGRIRDSFGRPLEEAAILIKNLETTVVVEAWTYAPDTVHPDSAYAENVVVSNLPAGPYEVQMRFVGHVYRAQFYLAPARSTVIMFDGRNGFTLEE